MGIDYGSKRIGVAISDENNTFALPKKVIVHTRHEPAHKIVDELNEIKCDNSITHIIIGESKNFKGEDNSIMPELRAFKETLENGLAVPVLFEPEFLTSHQAASIQGDHALLDASAAALILQSYLDRVNAADNK